MVTATVTDVRDKARGLLILDSPLSAMCEDCGDINPLPAIPTRNGRTDWEAIERAFHCRCEAR